MYKTLTVRVVGIAPLILNNVQVANPFNKYARAMKEITDKGGKNMTEADYAEKAKVQFMGALYMNETGPIIPAHMIEATLIAGAKKSKKGAPAKAGILVEEHASLEYDGPRKVDEMLADNRFVLSVMVKIGNGKVPSTRPIFPNWAAELNIKYLPQVINERDVLMALRKAGMLCGFGDWKPRHGRFALAEDLQQLEAA